MLLSCLSIGLTLNDFERLKVGTLLDLIATKINQMSEDEDIPEKRNEDVRKATVYDDIMSFF